MFCCFSEWLYSIGAQQRSKVGGFFYKAFCFLKAFVSNISARKFNCIVFLLKAQLLFFSFLRELHIPELYSEHGRGIFAFLKSQPDC